MRDSGALTELLPTPFEEGSYTEKLRFPSARGLWRISQRGFFFFFFFSKTQRTFAPIETDEKPFMLTPSQPC